MSNQCRNCGRDVNNNYTPYTNAYGNKTNAKTDPSSTSQSSSTSIIANNSTSSSVGSIASNQITAKVMFGTVGALNELREKEQAEKNSAARAGRRQWFTGSRFIHFFLIYSLIFAHISTLFFYFFFPNFIFDLFGSKNVPFYTWIENRNCLALEQISPNQLITNRIALWMKCEEQEIKNEMR